jgi:hypothetical protein
MRQLATIQKIKEILPIEGRDRIALATFYDIGWKVIAGKEEVKPDDKVVYFETDSLLPIKEEYEFLRSRCYNAKLDKFRIRTMKMGQVWSEGLLIPIAKLPKDDYAKMLEANIPEEPGSDLTELLEIKEYGAETEKDGSSSQRQVSIKSPALKLLLKYRLFRYLFYKWFDWKKSREITDSWAEIIPIGKTDETRVQNLTYLFGEDSPLQGQTLLGTVKLDGSSCTILYSKKNKKFRVASRNNVFLNMKLKNDWIETVVKLKWDKALQCFAKKYKLDEVVLQGELVGPGIQKNRYSLKEKTIVWFNLWAKKADEKQGRYWSYDEMSQALRDIYDFFVLGEEKEGSADKNLDSTPSLFCGYAPVKKFTEFVFDSSVHTLQWFEDIAVGADKDLTNYPREGIVFRAKDHTLLQNAQKDMSNMLSFKVINREFSLKND